MAASKELKHLLMKVKEESEKIGLKLKIKKKELGGVLRSESWNSNFMMEFPGKVNIMV